MRGGSFLQRGSSPGDRNPPANADPSIASPDSTPEAAREGRGRPVESGPVTGVWMRRCPRQDFAAARTSRRLFNTPPP